MLRYTALVVVQLAFGLLARVLAPLLSLFTAKGWPTWGAWFWTPDNDPCGDRSDWTTLPVGSYWRRVFWLWRNPGYGFDASVVAVKLQRGDLLVTTGYANNLGTGPSHPGASGTQRRTVWRDGRVIAWEYYYVKQWRADMCVRTRTGWKVPIGPDGDIDVTRPATLVFSFNPFMGFST